MDSSDDEYIDDIDVTKKSSNKRKNASEHTSYSWEDEYHRSWDVVQEDSGGSLATTIAGMLEQNKRRLEPINTKPVHRGIIRNLVLVLDMSLAMNDTDMQPSRFQHTISIACEFITEFFSQNPISQLSIIGIRDRTAFLVSNLDGNPHMHIQKLEECRKLGGSGVPSLQNALDLARAVLLHTPIHNSREVILVFGALMSSDPGQISQTIDSLKQSSIRVRIIGLAAQVAVCNRIASETNYGDQSQYQVVMNEVHFKQLFMEGTTPLATSSMARANSYPVRMGFPKRTRHSKEATLCACHAKLTKKGYTCPQCKSKVCTLPMSCPVCQLTLILSTHLARSYHHLMPLQGFEVLDNEGESICFGCSEKINGHEFKCPDCSNKFCVDCDVFCHSSLHNCPGCEVKPV